MTRFGIDKPEEILLFNEVCKKRARLGSPVVIITAIMDRKLLGLDGKTDYFFQIGKIEMKGRRLAIKEQATFDNLAVYPLGNVERKRMYGQMKLGEG